MIMLYRNDGFRNFIIINCVKEFSILISAKKWPTLRSLRYRPSFMLNINSYTAIMKVQVFCLLLLQLAVVGKISIELPTPLYDSAISRIFDPVQLEAEDASVVLSGFLIGNQYSLVCTFDNTVNTSAFDFHGSNEDTTAKIPLPLYRDGPHTITVRVFDGSKVQVDFAEIQIEVRAGWNSGELRDPLCPLCEFTTDWTKDHVDVWVQLFENFSLPHKSHWSEEQNHSGFDLLEIGSWEGRYVLVSTTF